MLGGRIKQHMDENGLKYSYIAERAHIPCQTFSAMLNGKRSIKAEEYFDICKALNVEPNEFAQQRRGGEDK